MGFTATGGSGSGYSWSFGTNNSGGSINTSTGAYTAGPTGSVTDTVKVTDSLGNSATSSITVTAPSGGGGGCSTSTAAPSILMLGLAALLHRRRRGARQDRGKGDG